MTEGNSGTTTATFTVTLSVASTQTVTVNYATADGTAAPAATTRHRAGTLTFAPGETSKTITVPGQRRHDVRAERDVLRQPVERRSTPPSPTAQGVGTIINDDAAPPTLAVERRDRDRGQQRHDHGDLHRHPVGRQRLDGHRQLRHRQRHGHGRRATTRPPAASLTFAPGETAKTVTVPVIGDTTLRAERDVLPQPVERRRTPPSPTARASGRSSTTTPRPTLAVNDVTVTEGNSGDDRRRRSPSRCRPPAPRRSRSTTPPPTARRSRGSDFTSASGTLTFAAGQTSKTVTVPVIRRHDGRAERDVLP